MKTNTIQSLNHPHIVKPTTGRRKVDYGHTGRRWVFKVGNYEWFGTIRGGRKTADRIADILSKGVVTDKNTKLDKITGGARLALNRLTQINCLNANFIPEYLPDMNEAERLAENMAHPATILAPEVEPEQIETEEPTFQMSEAVEVDAELVPA